MRSHYGSNVAFLDMTLNALMGISALFIIAFLLIREEDKKTDVPEPPVMIMAVLSWPNEGPQADADIDLWVQVGEEREGLAVGFRSPTREGIALELDDLGSRNDKYTANGRKVVIPINREVINFRRIPKEEIIVNAMFYHARDKNLSVPVTVQVFKLNPFKVIYEGAYTLQGLGDERTFVRFKMDEDGHVKDMNHRQKSIVYAKHPVSGDSNDWPVMREEYDPAHLDNYEMHQGGY